MFTAAKIIVSHRWPPNLLGSNFAGARYLDEMMLDPNTCVHVLIYRCKISFY